MSAKKTPRFLIQEFADNVPTEKSVHPVKRRRPLSRSPAQKSLSKDTGLKSPASKRRKSAILRENVDEELTARYLIQGVLDTYNTEEPASRKKGLSRLLPPSSTKVRKSSRRRSSLGIPHLETSTQQLTPRTAIQGFLEQGDEETPAHRSTKGNNSSTQLDLDDIPNNDLSFHPIQRSFRRRTDPKADRKRNERPKIPIRITNDAESSVDAYYDSESSGSTSTENRKGYHPREHSDNLLKDDTSEGSPMKTKTSSRLSSSRKKSITDVKNASYAVGVSQSDLNISTRRSHRNASLEVPEGSPMNTTLRKQSSNASDNEITSMPNISTRRSLRNASLDVPEGSPRNTTPNASNASDNVIASMPNISTRRSLGEPSPRVYPSETPVRRTKGRTLTSPVTEADDSERDNDDSVSNASMTDAAHSDGRHVNDMTKSSRVRRTSPRDVIADIGNEEDEISRKDSTYHPVENSGNRKSVLVSYVNQGVTDLFPSPRTISRSKKLKEQSGFYSLEKMFPLGSDQSVGNVTISTLGGSDLVQSPRTVSSGHSRDEARRDSGDGHGKGTRARVDVTDSLIDRSTHTPRDTRNRSVSSSRSPMPTSHLLPSSRKKGLIRSTQHSLSRHTSAEHIDEEVSRTPAAKSGSSKVDSSSKGMTRSSRSMSRDDRKSNGGTKSPPSDQADFGEEEYSNSASEAGSPDMSPDASIIPQIPGQKRTFYTPLVVPVLKERKSTNVKTGRPTMITSTPKAPPVSKTTATVAAKTKPKPRSTKQTPGSLSKTVVKGLFSHFLPGKMSKDVVEEVEKSSSQFWENAACDLESFAKHAHRKTIDETDVELLMKRQRFITPKGSLFSLVEKYLPLELRQELIPMCRSGNKVELK